MEENNEEVNIGVSKEVNIGVSEEVSEEVTALGLTMQEITDYLGIDYTDARTDRVLTRTLKVADLYLKGSIGEDYPVDDERAKELALIVIDDLYSNRGLSDKVAGTTRRLVDDFTLQLKLELRRKKESQTVKEG